MLEKIKEICFNHELALHETESGALIVELPEVNSHSILFVTIDGGDTWTPEVAFDHKNKWSGRFSLTGSSLYKETLEMIMTVPSNRELVKTVTSKLGELSKHGKIFS